jgi:hypothetical protein
MYEETAGTLLCGDLFTAIGDGPAITEHEIVGPALRAEDIFGATCHMPSTAPAMRTLAALAPVSLGLMHGPAYTGDCAQVLFDLADACEQRLEAEGVRGAGHTVRVGCPQALAPLLAGPGAADHGCGLPDLPRRARWAARRLRWFW